MRQRNVLTIASAFALLAITACGDDDSPKGDDRDAATSPAKTPDAATDARVPTEAGTRPDGGARPDAAAADAAVADAGDLDASGSIDNDAAQDARVEDAADANVVDANVVDANVVADAGRDAQAVDAGTDAATADAGTDAGLPVLAAWYRFNENTGTTSADSTSSFPSALLLNGASWTSGKQGSAVDLAGGTSNNHVSLPLDLFESCNDVTVAMWMKLGSDARWARLLDIDSITGGFLYFTPTQDVDGQPHLYFDIFHASPGNANDQGVSAAYPANTQLVDVWHHVAFTLTAGVGRLYFDGKEIGASPMATKPSDLEFAQAGTHAWLGRSTFPVDPYLDASLDDLRVSCTAYSAAQLAAIAQ